MLPHQLIYQSIVTVIKDRLGMRHRRGYHCACMTLYSSESLVKYRGSEINVVGSHGTDGGLIISTLGPAP